MVIFVTGATGTVGSEVVRHLANKDVEIRLGVHHVEKAAGLLGARISVVPIDYMSIDTLERAFEDVDKVFLLTPPVTDGRYMALRAIDMMRGLHIQQVVRLSVYNAEQEPGVALTRDHRTVELTLEDSGLPWTFLRPNLYMDNLRAMASSIRDQGVIALPLNGSRISSIAASDIGAVVAEVLTTPGHTGKAYTLTGPEALSGDDYAAALSEASGHPVRYQPLTEEMLRQALSGKISEERLAQVLELNATYRAGQAAQVTDTVQQLTRRPPISLREWARQHANLFRQPGARAA